MNLILFLILFVIGFICSIREINDKKNNVIVKLLFIIIFIITCISRVGHSYEYSDLTHYIDYYKSGDIAYFENGYVWFENIVEKFVGKQGTQLVGTVSLWTIFFTYCAYFLNRLKDSTSKFQLFKIKIQHNTAPSFFVFIFIFMVYWGFAFCTEGLRNGLATSLLLCSASLCISGYVVLGFCPIIFASLFHVSASIFYIIPLTLLLLKRLPNKKQYIAWFWCLVFMDLFLQITNFISTKEIFSYFVGIDLSGVDRLMVYEDSDFGNYINTQYITYHIIGFFMAKGPVGESRYNKSVLIYYIGLTLGSIFQSTAIAMRIQWLFLVMSVFVIYYTKQSLNVNRKTKKQIIAILSILYAVMVLRYLGFYL